MFEELQFLIQYALLKKASDIHFVVENGKVEIQLRMIDGMESVHQDIWKKEFFEYLKYISGFDLTNPHLPQSGQFSMNINGKEVFCRFSVIFNKNLQTGVLRILNTKADLKIDQLSKDADVLQFMKQLTHQRQGLIVSCGPTNSGKTTTLHAILHEIARQSSFKVVSLEDPIEIEDENYLQLEINDEQGFTYEKGIEELLRHDPDVIFIGETRNEYTARMVVRAALTGHLVLTTIHSKNALECVQRFLDFGIDRYDLQNTLTSILAQRLYKSAHQGKECIYEILTKKEIRYVLEHYDYPKEHQGLGQRIQKAVNEGIISDRQALFDISGL